MPNNQSFGVWSRNYNATLLICLLGSAGICFAFLPIIPLRVPDISSTITFVGSVCTGVLSFAAFALSVYLLRHRKTLHREGRILWPMCCHHCARLTGLRPKCSAFIAAHYRSRFTTLQRPGPSPSSSAIPSSPHRPDGLGSALCLPYDDILVPGPAYVPIRDEHSSDDSSQSERYFPGGDSVVSSTHIRRYNTIRNEDPLVEQSTFSANCSMVNLFNVFGVWAVVGFLCAFTGSFTCEYSYSLLSDGFVSIAHVLIVSLAMLFFASYHDAVFIATATNCVLVAAFVSVGLWICCIQVIMPLQPLMNASYKHRECLVNGTIQTLYHFGTSIMQPVYTEGTIIATALCLQMWNALVPQSELKLDDDDSQHQERQEQSLSSRLRAVRTTCGSYFNHMFWPSQMVITDESQRLFTLSSPEIPTYAYRAWTISLTFGISYFTMSIMFIAMPNMFSSLNIETIIWSIEIAFLIPLIILLVKESNIYWNTLSLTVVSREYTERKFKGHDVLLLLCTCGIFSQNFFRSSAAVGLLVKGVSLSNDRIMLCVSAIVYSLVVTITIWLTTAFLLNIQRYSQGNLQTTKWNLYCIIYIIVMNGMEWAISSFSEEHYMIQTLFFGTTTGKVIGVLLEPFSSLYQLHTAMIAYEIYKGIMRDN